MNDNVIIFGAGASVDAGIPVLRNFVDCMWEIAIRGRVGDRNLDEKDRNIFNDAMKMRDHLNSYHGRASFDDRNIEDILSILTFKEMAEDNNSNDYLSIIRKAISRTIELTCNVKHVSRLDIDDTVSAYERSSRRAGLSSPTESNIYSSFWNSFIKIRDNQADKTTRHSSLPTIISFNYDLVFERSLLRSFIETTHIEKPPLDQFSINYFHKNSPNITYKICCEYHQPKNSSKTYLKTHLEACGEQDSTNSTIIPFLKLHGSLNFWHNPENNIAPPKDINQNTSLSIALDDPYILPPIFNKTSTDGPLEMWAEAIRQLRNAKHIIIVGYSLPRTDIYMQYFLKAAVGPNNNLSRIIVFDPTLFRNEKQANEMRQRYTECFAPQIHGRIEFNPLYVHLPSEEQRGTFRHFVEVLRNFPESILFLR